MAERQVDRLLGGLWEKDREEARRREAEDREWEEYSAPKKHDALFDFIRKLFSGLDNSEWDNVTSYEKQRNAFMVNRFMAIRYPTSACNLNRLKCDGFGVVETWRNCVGLAFKGRVPAWIYTKSGKKAKNDPFDKVGKEAKLWWCRSMECGMRDLEEQYKYNPSVLDDLRYIEDNFIKTGKSKTDDI